MIILLHGADSFRGRQKLNLMVEQFKKQRDPQGNNVVKLEGDKITIDELDSMISSQSLLAERRLLVIENLFNHKQKNVFESILKYLQKIEKEKNDNTLIFYENRDLEPDSKKNFGAKKLLAGQKKLFNYLSQQKFSAKFDSLSQPQTIIWMHKNMENGVKLLPSAANEIIVRLGTDLWRINNELNKLINFAQAEKRLEITENDVKNLICDNINENIFVLTDAISVNNKGLFFKSLEDQLEAGVSFQQILTMIIRQFNIMLQIKELLLQGGNPAGITGQLKLHPFVVKKTIPQTRNFSLDNLKKITKELIRVDYKTKTGQADGLTSLNLLFAK